MNHNLFFLFLLLASSHISFSSLPPQKRAPGQSQDERPAKKQKVSKNNWPELDTQYLLTKGLRSERLDWMQQAIDAKADLNAKTPSKYTPLTEAAYNGYFAAVKLLVENGADINLPGMHGHTPLTAAINSTNYKTTPLIASQIALYLIEHGADINKPTTGYSDEVPLYFAINRNQIQLAKKLIESGAVVNITGKTYEYSLLATAINRDKNDSHKEIIELLLQKGADINYQPKNHQTATPMSAAVRTGNNKLAKSFVKHKKVTLNSSLLGDAYHTLNEEMAYIILNKVPDTYNRTLNVITSKLSIEAYKIKQMIRAKEVELLEIE